MSEDHSSGSGIGKTVVLLIFGVMVGFYAASVMSSGSHEPKHAPKFTEADFEKVKSERDASLAEAAKLTEKTTKLSAETAKLTAETAKLEKELDIVESRAVSSEYRLGRVRNLLVAEDRVSGK
jgi:uncharacterized membrane protein YgaE (UPF0421/DUF939 family)